MIQSIDSSACVGCGACVERCPLDTLRLREGKAVIAHGDDCMTCYLCEMACPTGAMFVHPFKEPFPTVFPPFLMLDQKGEAQ